MIIFRIFNSINTEHVYSVVGVSQPKEAADSHCRDFIAECYSLN